MADLTDAQEAALDKAWDLIKEHFDNAVLIIETEVEQSNTPDNFFVTSYHGGVSLCIGLMERAKHRLIQKALSPE